MNRCVERRGFGPELCELKDEWDELLRRGSRPSIYSTFDFIYTSLSHFKENEEIFFLLFRDASNGRLLAIFPLSIWNDQNLGITVRTIRHGVIPQRSDIDKPYPIIDRDCEQVCWCWFRDYFRKEFRKWDIMVFDELFVESFLYRGLDRLFRRPFFWTKIKSGPDSPIIRLDGCLEEFWAAHPNMRKKDRRTERLLGDRFAYVVTNDPSDVERCFSEYVATEQIGWKVNTGIGGESVQRFYRDLLPKLAGEGQVYFGMMYDGNRIVSAEISYVFMNRVYFALGTYNPAYAKLSPGSVSTSRFIRYFFGKGYVEGDFLAGYAHYVVPWSSHVEKTANVTIRRMGLKNWYLAIRHLQTKVKSVLFRSEK